MNANDFRIKAGQFRDALSIEERQSKSEAIWKRLCVYPCFLNAEQILFYISFKSEVDTTLMRELTRLSGKKVAAPKGNSAEKSMFFYLLEDEGDLESGPYGILQPGPNCSPADLKCPSLVIVPGMVFDFKGNRLGWGEGYYDRFLSGTGKGLPTLGLAFEGQLVERIPVQEHDVALDALVTESRLLSF